SSVRWIGRRCKDSNGNIQEVTSCTSDCKTGGSAPSWNATVGGTTTDSHVTWTNKGADADVLESNQYPLMGLLDWLYGGQSNAGGIAWSLGQAILDYNNNVQMVTTAGNSGATVYPTFSATPGVTTGDSGVV